MRPASWRNSDVPAGTRSEVCAASRASLVSRVKVARNAGSASICANRLGEAVQSTTQGLCVRAHSSGSSCFQSSSEAWLHDQRRSRASWRSSSMSGSLLIAAASSREIQCRTRAPQQLEQRAALDRLVLQQGARRLYDGDDVPQREILFGVHDQTASIRANARRSIGNIRRPPGMLSPALRGCRGAARPIAYSHIASRPGNFRPRGDSSWNIMRTC